MKTRPWPIIILSIFYFLGPFYNLYTGAKILHLPYLPYLSWIFTHAPASAWAKILLYPIAGIAIFAVKSWSYPVYLAALLVDSYFSFQDWRHFSNIFKLPMFFASLALNVLLVGYFLIPAVRAAYFNKRLRWWESKPRYAVRIRAALKNGTQSIRGSIMNLSEGGALVKTSAPLEKETTYQLQFIILGTTTNVLAQFVYASPENRFMSGLQFCLDRETERKMKNTIRALKALGIQSRSIQVPWWRSLTEWLIRIFKTGKGLVPELPERLRK